MAVSGFNWYGEGGRDREIIPTTLDRNGEKGKRESEAVMKELMH